MDEIKQKNVFVNPRNMFKKSSYRMVADGCCNTQQNDKGVHTVCKSAMNFNMVKKLETI